MTTPKPEQRSQPPWTRQANDQRARSPPRREIRDLEAIQRITTEDTTLKQRVRQLTSDNRTLDEQLNAARSNLRFLDRRIADSKSRLQTHHPAKSKPAA
jgi:septal ring factor EnvC (AmiA/AmiB activator)